MSAATEAATKIAPRAEAALGQVPFVCYCLFIVSYFLHLGNRIPIWGVLRLDLLLALSVFVWILFRKRAAGELKQPLEPISKTLWIMVGYIVVTLPVVKWPGSVVGHGWEPFVKAVFFYVLTLATVTTEKRLKWFLAVFIGAQVFRVLEPLYLHFTEGYWGSFTGTGNWEFMDRLSGAPEDIINPNGLAFVILVALSLMHHILSKGTRKQLFLYLGLLLPLLYAMLLTASRSGFLVLVLFGLMQIWRSKHRVVAFTAVGLLSVALLSTLSHDGIERYVSIVDHNAPGGTTAEGRVDGIWTDFVVGLERPIFGHGLGTSAEANFNAYGEGRPSHTLYTEVLQELGFIGLGIFMTFIVLTWKNCVAAVRLSQAANPNSFLTHTAQGVKDFALLLGVFSIASYGLNEYQWYLLGGLSVLLVKLASQQSAPQPAVGTEQGRAQPSRRARPRLNMSPPRPRLNARRTQ